MSGAVFTTTVEWGDCDPAQIVFYPNYFAWFDAAFHRLLERAGLAPDTLYGRYGVIGFPLVEAKAKFVSPAAFRDRLEIDSRVVEFRSRALVVAHTVRNGARVAVEGSEARVWGIADPGDPRKLKAGLIPDEIREKLGAIA